MDIFTAITNETFVERFWSKIDKQSEGCWEWVAGKQRQGYGQIEYKGRRFLAHRLAYLLHYGALEQNLCICHKCDNKACCNPKHLFMGTQKDNTQDCINKGRAAFQNINKERAWDVGTLRRNVAQCKRGHAFSEKNTGKQAKGRYCKRCEADRKKESRKKD